LDGAIILHVALIMQGYIAWALVEFYQAEIRRCGGKAEFDQQRFVNPLRRLEFVVLALQNGASIMDHSKKVASVATQIVTEL